MNLINIFIAFSYNPRLFSGTLSQLRGAFNTYQKKVFNFLDDIQQLCLILVCVYCTIHYSDHVILSYTET